MSSHKPNNSINVSPEEIEERGEKVALGEIEESFHPDKEDVPLERERRRDLVNRHQTIARHQGRGASKLGN
jgi:hypothetical protein